MSGDDGTLRLIVVDDHPVVREGLRVMLNGMSGFRVVGEAASGERAIDMAHQLKPHVVLTDIRMPDMSGIEVTRQIKTAYPSIVVIILTMYDSEMYILEALRAGAGGYLLKNCSSELLGDVVRMAMRGGTVVESGPLSRALRSLSRAHHQGKGVQDLPVVSEHFTAREWEVLAMMCQGSGNRDIAGALNLANVTVKKYVQSIIGKMGVSDRTSAAVAAVRMGLVE
ncbi:MAG: response regulator transcription factor [Chloroflexi bacterium]|nr:response regulator transcription factor [Chloroflexota bacterium]